VRSAVQVNVTGARGTRHGEGGSERRPLLAEGNYLYPLPGEAVFSDFSLWQGDQELKGEPMDAAQAARIYERSCAEARSRPDRARGTIGPVARAWCCPSRRRGQDTLRTQSSVVSREPRQGGIALPAYDLLVNGACLRGVHRLALELLVRKVAEHRFTRQRIEIVAFVEEWRRRSGTTSSTVTRATRPVT